MVKIRTAKSKGSSFEYDCQESLQPFYTDIYRTSERGFQMQYDLRSDDKNTIFECKRHKDLSWNQLKKYFLKLDSIALQENSIPFLLFKPNRQPCLVMHRTGATNGYITVSEFEDIFRIPFVKHKSTRRSDEINQNKNRDLDIRFKIISD